MINLNPFIYKKLKETGIRVVRNYPKSKNEYPCIMYQEIVNIPAFKVKGVEVISDISYQFEVYCLDDREVTGIVKNIDNIISSLGFTRKFNQSMDTEKYYRRVLRYAGKVDIRNNLVFE